MIRKKSAAVLIGCVVACTGASYGDFVADEFNDASLGPQWTLNKGVVPGKSEADSTYTMTGSAFRLTVDPGADQYFSIDNYCHIQQDAPSGNNWEVVTKIDNFDTSAPGYRLPWQKAGLMLFQDTEHWILIGMEANSTGNPPAATSRSIHCMGQLDPTTSASTDGRYTFSYDFWDNTSATIYLKIRKTPSGYTGFFSGDGVTYTQLTPLIKNPETNDGMFQGEKIRLMQSGGNTTNTGALAHYADFDYVRSQRIGAWAMGYKDDEFNDTWLDPVWFYSQGVTAGSMTVSGGSLNMTAAPDQDFWADSDRSSFVAQDAPREGAYSLVTKVGPTDLRAYQSWCGHGMTLWQDQNNWVAISVLRSSSGNNIVQTAYQRGNATMFNNYDVDYAQAAAPGYLRIDKNITGYQCQFSFDGVNWTAAPTTGLVFYPAALRNAQVQLFAKKANFETGPIVTSQFDWIHKVALPTAAQDWQLLE